MHISVNISCEKNGENFGTKKDSTNRKIMSITAVKFGVKIWSPKYLYRQKSGVLAMEGDRPNLLFNSGTLFGHLEKHRRLL